MSARAFCGISHSKSANTAAPFLNVTEALPWHRAGTGLVITLIPPACT